ncbi:MAG: formylglycine-generating enzyme family protein [Immundisolibacteraceae bacterium]|nr:formylglycine-generating enzyme family protein [Immundisolibacteraceae bacterium]
MKYIIFFTLIIHSNFTENSKSVPFHLMLKNMKMTEISASDFIMGMPKLENMLNRNQIPQHKVTISNSFYIGKYEVTQKQWRDILGENPSHFKGNNLPVENVSWLDVQTFIIELNKIVTCNNPDTLSLVDKLGVNAVPSGCFRLPTEAEWEYSARAGAITSFTFGDSINPYKANFNGYFSYPDTEKSLFTFKNTPRKNRRKVYRKKTVEVGSYMPNKFGLYDVHGNVAEWCHDYYLKIGDNNRTIHQIDPVNTTMFSRRIYRGGAWSHRGYNLHLSYRDSKKLKEGYSHIGFRLLATH